MVLIAMFDGCTCLAFSIDQRSANELSNDLTHVAQIVKHLASIGGYGYGQLPATKYKAQVIINDHDDDHGLAAVKCQKPLRLALITFN